MTHFATADDDPAFMSEQLERVRRAGSRAIPACWSTPRTPPRRCASRPRGSTWSAAGSRSTAWTRSTATRPTTGWSRRCELVSYVAEVKRARPGESAGYGRRFVAERDTWIGTIPIGYGDGVRRGLTDNAEVLVDGRRVPLVGTVSMDNITVDLGDEPVERGTEAVLIGARGGERILAEDVAGRLGTINYEVTCGISARVPREYRVRAPLEAAREALAGREAWLVGGAVRDQLLGRATDDVDVSLAGDPREAARAVARATGGFAFQLSGAFGAWRVVGPEHAWHVDLVTLRDDDIAADLAARDFTINAMAEPLQGGELVDPHGGRADLEARLVRMVSGARRSPTTRCAGCAPCGSRSSSGSSSTRRPPRPPRGTRPGSSRVAPERVFAELKRVVTAGAVRTGLELMDAHGLTEAVLPELAALRGIEQNHFHHADVHDHTLEVLDAVARLERDRDLLGDRAAGRCSPSRSRTSSRAAAPCASPRCCTTPPSRRPAASCRTGG